MKDKKRIEILLKVTERIYIKHPKIQESIDSVIVGVCAEEDVSPDQVFFLLFFVVISIIMGHSRKNPNKRVEDIHFLWEKTTYGNSRGYIKRGQIFTGDQQKKSCRCLFFVLEFQGCNTALQNFQERFDLS